MPGEQSSQRGAARAESDAPPFRVSWGALYAGVLAWLAVLVVLFYLFTRAFR